jgi:hypothetical protein
VRQVSSVESGCRVVASRATDIESATGVPWRTVAKGAEPVLRCPDVCVAVQSLAALFGVASNRFALALADAAAVVEGDSEAELARAIVPALTAGFGRSPETPSRIHFFHGTRAFEPQPFAQLGVLPLRAVLDDLWERMRDLAHEIPGEKFLALRQDLEDGRIQALTYRDRLDTHDDGPNGVLVRDVLLNPKAYHSSEFIRIPEIVEDICVAARNEFHIDLEPRFESATTPCVVEFSTPPREVHKAITAACWYAEAAARGEIAGGDDAFWNFDGGGVAVPAEDIVCVDVDVRLR